MRISRTQATAIAAAVLAPSFAFAQDRDLKFTLDFIALGRHAPWYVAVAKGYFKEEKLNVTVMPSKGTADAIRAVETGIADIRVGVLHTRFWIEVIFCHHGDRHRIARQDVD